MPILKDLVAASVEPLEKEAFADWIGPESGARLIDRLANDQDFVLYAGINGIFIHSVSVPAELLEDPDLDDLLGWNFGLSSGAGVEVCFGDPPVVELTTSMSHTGSSILDRGTRLIFQRFFEGRLGEQGYEEILQTLTHALDLHFMQERNAYCRLDRNGDIEDVIRLSPRLADGTLVDGVVTITRDAIDRWMALTKSSIVLMFDFTRFRRGGFAGWDQTREPSIHRGNDVIYRSVVQENYAGYTRGAMVVRPVESRDVLLSRIAGITAEPRQYASFITQDFKNKRVAEINCGPEHIANYFTVSDLPFETSPAFFRPEVLLKYKADSTKYHLTDRTLSCRGTWSLQTYDINEEGQVHTYLIYLSRLPYEEQLHWKSYNEAPKAPISRRAFKSDFQGKWTTEYDPLPSLKNQIARIEETKAKWWNKRPSALVERTHYPATASADEWSNEILHLDQLAVEGFDKKVLRNAATALGQSAEAQLGSLKLVEQCLVGLGFGTEDALAATKPFHELHWLRSRVKGHASDDEAVQVKRKILAEHGSFRKHLVELCSQLDESLKTIREALSALPGR